MAKKPTKYQLGARGQDCTLRFTGCRNNTETVVLCHLPGWLNKIIGFDVIGTGLKAKDDAAADGCSHCHDVLDKRVITYTIGDTTYSHGNMAIAQSFLRGRDATRANRERRGIT